MSKKMLMCAQSRKKSLEFQMCTSARGDTMRIIYKAFMSSFNRWHKTYTPPNKTNTYQFNEKKKKNEKHIRKSVRTSKQKHEQEKKWEKSAYEKSLLLKMERRVEVGVKNVEWNEQ